jgi:CoA-transferase family III
VLARRHPGLVAVYLDAWGHTGPWAERRGFDSVVQAGTGIAAGASSDGGTPGVLPCQLLDHGTGYLAAAAVLDGLRRQASEGGTHVRRLSLARTAAWLMALPPGPSAAGSSAGTNADLPDTGPWLVRWADAGGSVEAVGPPGSLDGSPLTWPGAPGRYQDGRAAWRDG